MLFFVQALGTGAFAGRSPDIFLQCHDCVSDLTRHPDNAECWPEMRRIRAGEISRLCRPTCTGHGIIRLQGTEIARDLLDHPAARLGG